MSDVRRVLLAYLPATVLMTAVILFVFAEPTLARLAGGPWQRRGFIYGYTLSLDVHAVAGFALLAFVLLTGLLGVSAVLALRPGIRRAHRVLGRVLALGVIPPSWRSPASRSSTGRGTSPSRRPCSSSRTAWWS